MKVSLIDYTGIGNPDHDHAINLLIFTKNTRLKMSPGGMSDIAKWRWEQKQAELEYMARTIPSSWEFVHYTFMIENVTRAFTHQLVRTRHGSYAQQTMRMLDVSGDKNGPGWTYGTGPTIPQRVYKQEEFDALSEDDQSRHEQYHDTMDLIAEEYKRMIRFGASIEDARGILPTNIHTNIVASFNLRTLVELIRKRTSPRTQGEYREFIEKMAGAVMEVHPWICKFISRTKDTTLVELDLAISQIDDADKRVQLLKLVDLLRGE